MSPLPECQISVLLAEIELLSVFPLACRLGPWSPGTRGGRCHSESGMTVPSKGGTERRTCCPNICATGRNDGSGTTGGAGRWRSRDPFQSKWLERFAQVTGVP